MGCWFFFNAYGRNYVATSLLCTLKTPIRQGFGSHLTPLLRPRYGRCYRCYAITSAPPPPESPDMRRSTPNVFAHCVLSITVPTFTGQGYVLALYKCVAHFWPAFSQEDRWIAQRGSGNDKISYSRK